MKRLSAVLLLCLTTAVSADVITLNDGTHLTGDVKKGEDGYVVTQMDGKVVKVPLEKVTSIELGKGAASNPAMTSQSHLASLRRAVENMTDIPAVVERYKRFIEQNAGTPSAKEAEADVAIWKDRQAKNLIRVGSKWMTADERNQLQEKSVLLAEQVRTLLKDGKIKEAEPLLAEALDSDPKNVSALYLRGVVYYRQEQLNPARKSFEAVLAVMPDHVPTLNNLGVILYRQRQYAGAMGFFDQALIASPGNKLIVDNVANALHFLPDDAKPRTQTQKATRHFTEQEAQLETAMAQDGWYRWGGTWVNQEQLDRIHTDQKDVQNKLDAMAQDFDNTKTRIDTINRQVGDTERNIRQIEASSYGRDANGNPIKFSYPPIYYELQKDLQRLHQDLQGELSKLDSLQSQAKTVQTRSPSPKFSDTLQIVGIEGAPVQIFGASTPTTKPATAPSN